MIKNNKCRDSLATMDQKEKNNLNANPGTRSDVIKTAKRDKQKM